MEGILKKWIAVVLAVMLVLNTGFTTCAEELTDDVKETITEDITTEEVSTEEETTEITTEETTEVTTEETTEVTTENTTEELSEVVEETTEEDIVVVDEETVEEDILEAVETTYSVKYDAHVQNLGWMNTVADGMEAGTHGRALRVEGMHIWVEKTTKDSQGNPMTTKMSGAITYQAHVQNYGWMKEVADGAMVGTNGEAKRMEAMRISLTGELAKIYDIYYRTHVQNYGWLGWAKNGQYAGTSDYALRMEAVEIKLVKKGEPAPVPTAKHFVSRSNKGMLTYQTHVQNIGWQDSVSDGVAAGTRGRGLRLEAIKIWLNNPEGISGGIEYCAHSQNVGWQNWVSGGTLSGTSGRSLRLEAIKIRLTGEMSNRYDVFYKVHSANIGDLGWAKNGEVAGSEGYSSSIEAIEIKLVAKGDSSAPVQNGRSGLNASYIGNLSMQGYVQNYAWQKPVGNNGIIGTSGRGLRLEAMKANVSTKGNQYEGNIYYAMYQQNTGWQAAVANGDVAGTIGKSVRAEAVKFFLSDELEKYCDIWYRAQVQDWGWLGWAKNGQEAGTKTIGARLEAIQVVITPKGAKAPGANRNYLKTSKKKVGDARLYASIANKSSNTNYIIAVDTQRCIVGIYQGTQGQWSQIQQYVCAPGKPSSPTVKGEFKVTGRGNSFGTPTYTCWYYTQFYGDYLFHSVLYVPGSKTRITESGLGSMASHGCVRLSIENAKWIYDHIPNGTKVFVY